MQKTTTEEKSAELREKMTNPAEIDIKVHRLPLASPIVQSGLAVLSARYILQALEDVNPLNIFRKVHPKSINTKFAAWETPGVGEYIGRNFPALGMGVLLGAGLMFYSSRTYQDMKTLYSEAIGYELNKDPKDVGVKDMFFYSKNTAVEITAGAFFRRTLLRFLSVGSFLFPWQVFRKWKDVKPKFGANLNAGVGIVGMHLAGENFLRSESFFDRQQHLSHTAIAHGGTNIHSVLTNNDIESMLFLQRRHIDKRYTWPKLDSVEGERQTAIADRIADLMNQTYNNTPKTGHADFTIGKFNYLVGFGLLDKDAATSLAFVELANQSKDMKEVKDAAAALQQGQDAATVFKRFGIDIDAMLKPAPSPSPSIPDPQLGKFAAMHPSAANTTLATPKSLLAKSPLDFATKPEEPAQHHTRA